MTNDQYLTVGRAIIDATDVSKVISLYEEAMEGRISADKYNLLAAQAAGIDSLNKYQPKQLDEDVELGELLEAELERLDAEARNYINNVTEQQYAANKQIITNKVNETKVAMDAIYDLANTKAAEADNLAKLVEQKLYNDTPATTDGLEGKVKDTDLFASIVTKLNTMADEGNAAMAETVKLEDYNKAKDLAKAKINAAEDLVEKFVELEAAAKKDYEDKETYTEADTERLENALKSGLDAVSAATLKAKNATRPEAGSVEKAQKDAETTMTNIKELIRSLIRSREDLNKYIAPLSTSPLPKTKTTATTVNYDDVEVIDNAIDAELAKIETFTFETLDDLKADRVRARKAIYETVRSYMSSLLDEYAGLVVNDTVNDKILSWDSYEAIEDNKVELSKALPTNVTTYTGYAADGALTTLITDFGDGNTEEKMVKLVSISGARTEMESKFKDTDEYKALDVAVLKSSTKYNQLSSVKTVLDDVLAKINNAKSYAEYETVVNSAKTTRLPDALDTELKALLKIELADELQTVKDSANNKITAAKTVAAKIKAYEDVSHATASVAELPDKSINKSELFNKELTELKNENIQISDGKITGTLGEVTEYTQFSSDVAEQSGHYLVLVLKNEYATSGRVSIKNGITGIPKVVTLDTEKATKGEVFIIRVTEKNINEPIEVTWTFADNTTATVTYDMSGLSLSR